VSGEPLACKRGEQEIPISSMFKSKISKTPASLVSGKIIIQSHHGRRRKGAMTALRARRDSACCSGISRAKFPGEERTYSGCFSSPLPADAMDVTPGITRPACTLAGRRRNRASRDRMSEGVGSVGLRGGTVCGCSVAGRLRSERSCEATPGALRPAHKPPGEIF